jgi:hypothetical protein
MGETEVAGGVVSDDVPVVAVTVVVVVLATDDE